MLNSGTDAERFAIAYGLDLSLLEKNLELSVEDRIAAHERALNLMLELQKAGQSLTPSP